MALNINSAKIEINAVDNTRSAFESVKNSIKNMTSSSAALSAGLGLLGGSAAIAGMMNIAKNAINAADAMNDLSKKTGISVEGIGAWSLAAEKSGTSIESIAKAIAKTSKYMVEHGDNLKKLGIEGKTAEEVMIKLAGIIQKLPSDDPRRVALSMEVMGKSAQDLLPLLSEGEKGLKAMLDRGKELNPITKQMAEESDKFNDQLAELKVSASGFGVSLASSMIPNLLETSIEMNKLQHEGNTFLAVLRGIAGIGKIAIDIVVDVVSPKNNESFSKTKIKELTQDLSDLRKNLSEVQSGGLLQKALFGSKEDILKQITIVENQLEAFKKYGDKIDTPIKAIIEDTDKANPKVTALQKQLDDLLSGGGEKAAKKQEEARKKLNAALLQDIQDEITRDQELTEANYEFKTKAEKELYDNKIKYLDLIQQRSEREFQEELKRQEEIKKADDDRAENINRTITDALMRGFESGVSFAKNFRNTLINMFKTLVLQPVISFIVNPVSGAISAALGGLLGTGNAAANTLGSASSAGGFAGLTNNLFNMITTSNASIVSGIESVGAYIANGMGGVQDAIGGFIGANSSAIADGFGYAGALVQLAQGNAFGAAGTAIGTYFGGPIGGAIGSFVGGLVGGLFGKKKRYESGVSGTYTNDIFSSSNINYKRGLGANDSLSGLSEAFSQSMGTLLNAFGLNSSISTSAVLGKKKKAWGVFDASFDGGSINYTKLTGKKGDPTQVLKEMINSVMSTSLVQAIQKSKLPAGIKSLFDGLTDQTAIQNMIQASVSLSNANSQLSASFGMTADQAAQVAKATGLVGDKMITFINELITASGGSSKARVLLDARQTLLGALGQDMPTTLLAFDNMIKAIDKSNAAGIDKVLGLLSVRAGFEQYTNAMDSIKLGVSGSTMGLRSTASQKQIMQAELAKMFNALNLAVPSSVEQLVALADSIDYTTEAGINLAMAFPSLVSAFQTANQQVAELAQTLDSTQFKTLVDFTRAQRYQDNGINLGLLPSYASGSDYINGDQIAQIHNGERILTATDNATLMQRLQSPQANLDALIAEIGRLRTENQAQQVAIVIATQKMAKILDKMDNNGVVLSEVDNSGTRIVIDTRTVP